MRDTQEAGRIGNKNQAFSNQSKLKNPYNTSKSKSKVATNNEARNKKQKHTTGRHSNKTDKLTKTAWNTQTKYTRAD